MPHAPRLIPIFNPKYLYSWFSKPTPRFGSESISDKVESANAFNYYRLRLNNWSRKSGKNKTRSRIRPKRNKRSQVRRSPRGKRILSISLHNQKPNVHCQLYIKKAPCRELFSSLLKSEITKGIYLSVVNILMIFKSERQRGVIVWLRSKAGNGESVWWRWY
jgi:hypothetical protein